MENISVKIQIKQIQGGVQQTVRLTLNNPDGSYSLTMLVIGSLISRTQMIGWVVKTSGAKRKWSGLAISRMSAVTTMMMRTMTTMTMMMTSAVTLASRRVLMEHIGATIVVG
jgi:hypothetical protein